MKKILFVCSMGMSSAIAVNALKKVAMEKGFDIDVNAVGAPLIEDELSNTHYDLIMVAPQIKHRFRDIEPFAKETGTPCIMILPKSYGPLGGPFLLKQVLEVIEL